MARIKIGIGFGIWRQGMPTPEMIGAYAENLEKMAALHPWKSDKKRCGATA